MSDLSDEEVEALRKLVPLADQIHKEAEYKAARRLVIQTWRTSIVLLAGLVAAVVLIKDQLLKMLGTVV